MCVLQEAVRPEVMEVSVSSEDISENDPLGFTVRCLQIKRLPSSIHLWGSIFTCARAVRYTENYISTSLKQLSTVYLAYSGSPCTILHVYVHVHFLVALYCICDSSPAS